MTLIPSLRGLFRKDIGLIATALILLLVAVLIPRIQLPRSTFDYIIVFDISQSMNVEDYELNGMPISRLDYARAAARRAVRDLPCGSRVGWGIFTEYRTLLLLEPVEVCANYSDLVASLENVDGRMRWGNSSEVAKGVYWAIRAAKETGGIPNILFVTDGQEAPPLDPAYPPQMFDDIKPGEVKGWLVGAGGDTPRRIPKTDEEGKLIGYWQAFEVLQRFGEGAPGTAAAQPREHLSSLREGHLKTLAKQVGLDYVRLQSPDALARAMRDGRFAQRAKAPTEVFWVPAAVALLLLLIQLRPAFSSSPRAAGARATQRRGLTRRFFAQ